MAKINISVCDLCKSFIKGDLEFSLSIRTKGKRGVQAKGDICEVCYKNLLTKLDDEVSLDKIKSTSSPVTIESKVLDEGITLQPSKKEYSRAENSKADYACSHDRQSFEEDKLKCKDCGEETPV